MPVIDCTELHKHYGDRTILDAVTLTIRTGEKVGLVGDNGSGKSTLGRILAGIEAVDEGRITRMRGARTDYLAQEPELPVGQSIREVVLSSLEAWNDARARHDALTSRLGDAREDHAALVAEQATVAEEIERLGGWERLHEAEAIISHLGIEDASQMVETLSGGERRRTALARILVGEPDLAILDEPTNHLDIEAIEWLEEHLASRFTGAVLLITHDRYVLDNVATRTLELERGRLVSFDGGYARFLEARAERRAHEERTERNRQNFLRRELEWLRRQPKARGTKQKARIARAQAAMGRSAPEAERSVALETQSERLGSTVLELHGLSIERAGRRLVQDFDLALARGERIGIVGPNGSGKTSLLLCLLGSLEPAEGRVVVGQNTHIGYLDQARADLDPDHTIAEEVAGERSTLEVAGEEIRLESYLERFLFGRGAWRTKVGVLSGGERARVCLAKLLATRTNLLLLDEPTNDLDVATLAALEEMLCGYGGSAIIVSHDRWFLDRVATAILAFESDGHLDLHRGGYSDYKARRDAELRRGVASQSAPRTGSGPARSVRWSVAEGGPRKLSYMERRELDGLLDRIAEAEERARELEERLADPATYGDPGGDIAGLTRGLEQARGEVETLTHRWEELESRHEATR